ncbi:MAG: formylglycine-generating enzyme family protein [Halieaceae bacterium]|nr:formylglycine-generating enzyme family protein [Halieaceae bacterium]
MALWLETDLHTPEYLQQLMATPEVDLRVRVVAANILAEIGDPRFVPTLIKDVAVILPDMVKIPGGIAVLGGEDADGRDNELPECEVANTPFELARYPVTNAEYECFIKAGGYGDSNLWTAAGQDWLSGEGKLDPETEQAYRNLHRSLAQDVESAIKRLKEAGLHITDEEADDYRQVATWSEEDFVSRYAEQILGEQRQQPYYWDDNRFNQPNQPVVGVNWYETMAYASWLSQLTDDTYRLPNEAQWEWAARRRTTNSPGRRYPWGDPWDPGRCNHSGSRLSAPSPVGVYPHGATPIEQSEECLFDLAGNVYEWMLSLYRPYPYFPDDGREDEQAEGMRSLRGGSWYVGKTQVRCAYRHWDNPWNGDNDDGFRLAKLLF